MFNLKAPKDTLPANTHTHRTRKLCAYAGTVLPMLVSHRRVVVATCDAWVLPGVPQRRRNVWCSAPSAPRASAGQGAKLAF